MNIIQLIPRKWTATKKTQNTSTARTQVVGARVQKMQRAQPQINPAWYNNPQLTDLTIVYGKNGEHRFQGHRLILCNASDWFMRASSKFKKADGREIVLHGDHPDGLEALFQFCYQNHYTEVEEEVKDGKSATDLAKKQFVQHVRVFATADKYGVDALRDDAFARAHGLVEHHVTKLFGNNDEVEINFSSFFRFAVEQVYLHPENVFSADQKISGAVLDPTATQSTKVSRPEASHTQQSTRDVKMAGKTIEPSGADSHRRRPNDVDAANKLNHSHLVHRIRHLLVKAAISVWEENGMIDQRHCFAPLAKEIPAFGADLAVAAMDFQLTKGLRTEGL